MAEQDQPRRPQKVTIQPAVEHDEAMPITASLAGTAVMKASATVIGPGQPQAGTIGEGASVLGLVVSGIGLGYGVGQSVGDIPGGVAGAAVGGVAACTTVRWRPARETTFKFIRWLSDEDRSG